MLYWVSPNRAKSIIVGVIKEFTGMSFEEMQIILRQAQLHFGIDDPFMALSNLVKDYFNQVEKVAELENIISNLKQDQ